MAGEFLLTGFFLFGLIFYFQYANEKNRERQIMHFIINLGYKQSQRVKLMAYNSTEGISIYIEKFSEGGQKSRRAYHRIIAEADVQDVFMFKITKRGVLSNMFAINKGDLPELSDFNVETANPYQTQLHIPEGYFPSDQKSISIRQEIRGYSCFKQ